MVMKHWHRNSIGNILYIQSFLTLISHIFIFFYLCWDALSIFTSKGTVNSAMKTSLKLTVQMTISKCWAGILSHHYHYQAVLTLWHHLHLSSIIPGWSSRLHQVFSQSCCMQVLAGRPALGHRCLAVDKRTSLTSPALLSWSCLFY